MSTTNVARLRRRGEQMKKRYDDDDDDDDDSREDEEDEEDEDEEEEERNEPALFKWQWYENTHVRVSSSAKDDLLPHEENDRVCERRDDDEVENASEDDEDDECETEEDSLESEKEENEGDVLNKTLSYRASYRDDALEELMLSSHAQEMTNGNGDDTPATGQSFGSGGKIRQSRRRRALRGPYLGV